MRLDNKVALITGGGSGIGRASALLFAREGARIVVSDLSEASAQETVREVRAQAGEAEPVSGDVSISQDALRMVQAAVENYGRLDILVNSAGISSRNALPEGASNEEVWDRVMGVNMKGTYLMTWHALPEMERAGGGSVVNLASIMALVGNSVGGGAFNAYGPSKGGVLQFTKDLAIDSAAKNIRVNCICPGYVETSLDPGVDRERRAAGSGWSRNIPWDGWGGPRRSPMPPFSWRRTSRPSSPALHS